MAAKKRGKGATLGQRLRALRTAHGLTQKALGEASGVGKMAVWHVETGRREPTLDTLRRLAHALDASWNDLLGDANA